jgi:hypothetical protein
MGILYHWVNSLGVSALLKDVAHRVATGLSGFMVVYVYVLQSYCCILIVYYYRQFINLELESDSEPVIKL